MTLYEALEIKEAIKKKKSIEKITGKFGPRLNSSFINLLAGMTESYCALTGMKYMTIDDLESSRKTFLYLSNDWNLPINVRENYKARAISCEKILEKWKESIEDEPVNFHDRKLRELTENTGDTERKTIK